MTREEIIRNLKYTMEKHKNDTVDTFGTNISVMCKDILDYLEQEPCEDAISRQAVKEFVESIQKVKDNHNENGTPINYGTICDLVISGWRLMKLPSVTPKPKTGHWIMHRGYNADGFGIEYSCSKCNEWANEKSNYCPNCGAKMESEE